MITRTKVRFIPAAVVPANLREQLEALGDLTGEVCVASTSGVCAVLLPVGITIPGFSLPDGEGRHFINVHQNCLEKIV